MAARLSIIEYDGKILCASANHWGLRPVKELGKKLRDSDYGGTSHAGEFETSLYLALRPDLVDMDRAVDERSPFPIVSKQIYWLAGTRKDLTPDSYRIGVR